MAVLETELKIKHERKTKYTMELKTDVEEREKEVIVKDKNRRRTSWTRERR